MVEISDHYERANALLASQFRDTLPGEAKNNMQKLLKGLIDSMQEIDNQNQELIFERFLQTAQGVQLDGIGQIVGLARVPGQTDQSYREDIQFQIFINQSNGTPEEAIQILKYLTDASKVWYFDMFPAAYEMATNGLTFPPHPVDLVTAIQQISPAGVNYVPIVAIYDNVPFTFSSDPIEELLFVAPDVNNPTDLFNLQVDTGELIEVNAGQRFDPEFGGGFCDVDAMDNLINTEKAGKLSELLQIEN